MKLPEAAGGADFRRPSWHAASACNLSPFSRQERGAGDVFPASIRSLIGHQKRAWREAAGDTAEQFRPTGRARIEFAGSHPDPYRLKFGRFTAGNRTDAFEQPPNAAFDNTSNNAAVQPGVPADLETADLPDRRPG